MNEKQALRLLILILFMATVDMFGVASIFPFIQLLSNPDLVNTNDIFNYLFKSQKL